MFQLDLKSRESIYEQIVNNFKELILTDVIKPHEKLPSIRELSKTLTVNPNTIQKAFRELESQGYVYTSSGIGTFANIPEDQPIDQMFIQQTKEKINLLISELFFAGLKKQEVQNLLNEIMKERKEWK